MAHCRPRHRITDSWCSRWCRRPTCCPLSRHDEALAAITLTQHGGWSFLLRNGHHRCRADEGRFSVDHRAGEAHPRQHRADHRGTAAIRHTLGSGAVRRNTFAGGAAAARRQGAGRRAGRPAAVVAVRCAADRPGGRGQSRSRAVADPADDDRARAIGRELRRTAQGGQLARRASLVRLRRLPSRDARAGGGKLSRRDLCRQREAVRLTAAAAVRATRTGCGARAARRIARPTSC